MKSALVTFLLLYLSQLSIAQHITVHEHVIRWEETGDDSYGRLYNFEIKMAVGEYAEFDSIYVCTPDGGVGFGRENLGIYERNDTLIFNIQYNKPYTTAGPEYLPGDKRKTENCSSSTVTLFTAKKRNQLNVTVRTETFVSY